jgi:signal transduction histidine kinase
MTKAGVNSSRRLGRLLFASFFGTILFFAMSTGIANYRQQGIIGASENIADDALPAIQHLASARTELREIAVALDDLTGGLPSERRPGEVGAEVQRSRELLNRDWHDYRALPPYRGEPGLQTSTEDTLHSAQASFDYVLARLQSGDQRGARNARNVRVVQDIERLDGRLKALLDLNAVRGAEQSRRISVIRRESGLLSVSLHVLSALFAVVAGFLVVRVVRRFVRVTDLRLSELEHFAGRVAHDIRSPLGSVGIALELAKKDPGLSDKARSRLGRSVRTVQRIGQVVDGLLVFAAAGGLPPGGARADVQEILTGVIEGIQPSAEAKDIDLRTGATDKGAVACSPGVLTSLFVNLIGNAIKYMGDVAVRRIIVRARDAGRMMRIEVQDSGPGVPPDLRERIFDPYVRAGISETSGLGLGLATVRRLVEAHGGSVGVQGNRDGGSLFWFTLPKASQTTDSPGPDASAVQSPGLGGLAHERNA